MAASAQHDLVREVLGHDERLFSAFLRHQLRQEVARNLFREDGAPDGATSRTCTGGGNPDDSKDESPCDPTDPFLPPSDPGFALDALRLESSLHNPLEGVLRTMYEEGFDDGGQATLDMVRELYGALGEKGDLSALEDALEGPEELSDAIERVRREEQQDDLRNQPHEDEKDGVTPADASPEQSA
ncbi:hypothetical protein [Parafannyhessea umbonata]|uniref:hypothetical protein n=1 Tax=Parafannyhessea umbonata TaxID=604330 RepID=UPI0026F2ACBE|nr:hypothetical protein [Parafannyhessea umbonata]MCI7219405.1 hypothetical protein [Parafannyhessea umbonata]